MLYKKPKISDSFLNKPSVGKIMKFFNCFIILYKKLESGHSISIKFFMYIYFRLFLVGPQWTHSNLTYSWIDFGFHSRCNLYPQLRQQPLYKKTKFIDSFLNKPPIGKIMKIFDCFIILYTGIRAFYIYRILHVHIFPVISSRSPMNSFRSDLLMAIFWISFQM